MTTVQQVITKTQLLRDEFVTIKNDIQQVVEKQRGGDLGENRDLENEIQTYKTKFEEEESKLQALGGKTRKQTLQEFVLLFFWISYAVFTVSAGLYSYRTTGSSAAQKMVGILFLLALVITAVLIRYA